MTRKEIYDTLSEGEKIAFLIGAMIYDDDTEKGKKPLTFEQADQYPDVVLQAVLFFLMREDSIDFELNPNNLQTAETCVNVLHSRRPPEYTPDVKAKWEEFKRDYFTDV